jgi:hypothetical protein
MADPLTLLLKFTADNSSAKAATREMTAEFKEMTAVLAVLAAGATAAAAALFELSKSASTAGDEIYRAHLRTQLTTESLSGLRLAAQENKVGFEQLTAGFDRYLRNVDEGALGNQKLSHQLSDLGINAAQLAGRPQAAIEALVKAWSELGPTADRNDVAIKQMGKSGDQLIPVLDALQGSLSGVTQKADDLGQLWDEKTAKQAHDLQVSIADLSNAWEGLKLAIGKETFEEVTFQIFRLTEAIKSNREEVGKAGPSIIEWAEILLDAGRRTADLIGGVLLTALLALMTPLELIALALQLISNLLIFILDWTVGWFPSIHRQLMAAKDDVNQVADAFSNLFSAVNKGAGNLLLGTVSKSPFAGSLEDELAFDEQQRQRAAADKAAQQRAGIRQLSVNDAKEREKARQEALKTAEEDAHARLKILEIATQEATRLYQEETAAQQREYDARKISLTTYLAEQEAGAQKLRDTKLAELAEERTVVEQTIVKASERNTRLAEINEKERAARSAYNQKLLADQAEVQQQERTAYDEHRKTLLDLADLHDRGMIASIQDFEQKKYITAQDAEERILAIERDALNRRQNELIEQLRLAGQNVEEQNRVNSELQKLAQERVNFEENAVRKLSEARRSDLEDLRRYQEQLKALRQGIAESELEAQRAEFENLKLGLLKREDLMRLQAERAIQAEQDRFAAESELHRKIQEDRAKSLRNDVDFQAQRASTAIASTRDLEANINRSISIISDLGLKISTARKTLADYEEAALKPDTTVTQQNIDAARTALQDAINESQQEQAKLDGAREKLKITRETETAARADYDRATDELRAVEAEGRKKDEDAVAKHAAKMKELEGQRDAVVVTEKRVLATRKELIQAETDFEDRAIRLRHDRAVAHLELERQDLEAQLAQMKRAVDEGKADEAQLRVIKGRIDEINQQIKAEDRKRDASVKTNQKQGVIDQKRADPSSNRSIFGDTYADTLDKTGSKLEALGATAKDVFEGMSAHAGNMTSMLSSAFLTLGEGLASTAEAFLTTGKLSGRALATLLTQTLAHLAVESGIKALYELAAGYASAAIYDYEAATKHFAAASFYGEVAAIAGAGAIASRLAFGTAATSAGAAQGAGAGSGDGSGSNAPTYAPFNNGSPSFSASQAASGGSRTDNVLLNVLNRIADGHVMVANAVNYNTKVMAGIESIPEGDIIRRNPSAVGDAMQENYRSYHPVTQDTIALGSTGRTR